MDLDAPATGFVTASGHVSQQVAPAAPGAGRTKSGQLPPAGHDGGGSVTELSAVAYVESLDGAGRTLLLNHIARAWPEVVKAGAELVAQWRAEAAEHRRKNARRREHDRRRRRRADTGRQA